MPREPAALSEQEGNIRIIRLNRPERRNALDLQDRRDLIAELDAATADPKTSVIVLTGVGPIFSAGGDIRSMPTDPEVARVRLRVLTELVGKLVEGPKAIVSAVEGGAFGLGLSLVATTDYVVASREARFAASFGKLGLVPDTGLFWSLPRRIGAARAQELVLLANDMSASEAHAAGLVSELVEPGMSLPRALEVAGRIASGSPHMIAATRRIFAQPDQSLAGLLAAEADAQMNLLATDEFAQRRDAFLGRR